VIVHMLGAIGNTGRRDLMSLLRSRAAGYAVGFVVPVLLTYLCSSLKLPPFVFEHLVVLLVLGVAVPWGLGPAVAAVLVSVVSDNVLLREPVGSPTITGYRDLLDLFLFAAVAIVVSSLVTRAHAARAAAQDAAVRERRAREERDRLIATISHDLATPLSVLSGTVQFAKYHGATEVDWAHLLQRLDTATARATSLLRMLSDAHALETESFGLDLRACDLRTLVTPIVQMMDRFSERHPVVLSTPDTPIVVNADAALLQRVLENLVNNAIKYSPHGGTVEVHLERQGNEAVMSVRDYGIGISLEALPHIFDRSFRAPEATAFAPGLGLGLSIAAEVVARHGGAISATRAEGSGTKVSVRLPVVDAAAEAFATTDSAMVKAGSRLPQKNRVEGQTRAQGAR
jgi:signal transduction histidine kinase